MCKKKHRIIFTLLCLVSLLCLPARGAEYEFGAGDSVEYYPESEMSALADSLPEDVRREIDSFVKSEDDTGRVDALKEKTGIKYWLGYVGGLLRELLIPSVKGGASLLCIVLLSAVMNTAMSLSENGSLRSTVTLIMTLATAAVTARMCLEAASAASSYITNISHTMTAMTPVMGAVMMSGGSLTQASVNNGALMLYLTVTENLSRLVIIPLCSALLALSTVSGVFTGIKTDGFVSSLRRLLMTLIGFSMLVFSFVLGIQTSLARSADSLTARTVRFALGSYVPVVGGAVSEAFSTLSASLSMIRRTAGGIGIVIVLLILLPTLVTVLLTRLNLILCKSTAELLGCSEAVRLIGEADGITAVFCAMAILSAVFFIFALVLFMSTVT